jgi:maltose/moltooligosaccharide transporter
MCFGLFGVQIVWGLQNVNTSRIFQTLGAELDDLADSVDRGADHRPARPADHRHLSDRTWGPLGRRRPYLFGGALLTALALFADAQREDAVAASLMLWVLTASINIAMEPFRALVADTLPEAQRTAGFAMQVFFIGVGRGVRLRAALDADALVRASAAARAGHAAALGAPLSISAASGLLVAVTWTSFTTPKPGAGSLPAEAEPPPIPTARAAPRCVARASAGCLAAADRLATALEAGARNLCVAGIAFLFGLASSPRPGCAGWGAARSACSRSSRTSPRCPSVLQAARAGPVLHLVRPVRDVDLHRARGRRASLRHRRSRLRRYNEGADWVGVLFAGYNGVAALGALLLPGIARLGSAGATHALCLRSARPGWLGFLLSRSGVAVAAAIGIGWPGRRSCRCPMRCSPAPCRPARWASIWASTTCSWCCRSSSPRRCSGRWSGSVFHGQAIYALALSAGSLALAAVFSLTVPRSAGD